MNANTDAQTSGITSAVNTNTNTVVGNASSSLASTLPGLIWNYTSRTLSGFGTLVADVWSNATRTLTGAGLDSGSLATASDVSSAVSTVNSNTNTSLSTASSSLAAVINANTNSVVNSASSSLVITVPAATSVAANANWSVSMSDYSSVQTGKTYRARVQVLNNQSAPTAPFAAPAITLYDADRNVVVSGVSMTNIGTGLYEYTYSVSSGASQGVWEAIATTQVESGKTITTNDYWIVAGSPAQVIINSVSGNTPTATANLTITNEGLAGYEYHYEWCVVSSINNTCGGGDDVYHGTGAKFINPGEDWNTNLTATVTTAGSYYFKVIVYFGTESSGSSRSFTITDTAGGGSSGGGGGGGSSSTGTSSGGGVCKGADFNGDDKVNSVDFSILLSFWKTKPPFKNTCVDVNKDTKVDSVDFSILLSQWGTRGKAL